MYKTIIELIEKIDELIELQDYLKGLSEEQANSNIEKFEEIKKLLGKVIV